VPHVELLGPVSLSRFQAAFRPGALSRGGRVLKAAAAFLSQDGRSLLVECLTVEGHLRQSFFVLATAEEGRAMVRLLPRTSPEKTLAVKECVVWVALGLRAQDPAALRFGTTNLEGILARDWSEDQVADQGPSPSTWAG
jgi:hypothetical protein